MHEIKQRVDHHCPNKNESCGSCKRCENIFAKLIQTRKECNIQQNINTEDILVYRKIHDSFKLMHDHERRKEDRVIKLDHSRVFSDGDTILETPHHELQSEGVQSRFKTVPSGCQICKDKDKTKYLEIIEKGDVFTKRTMHFFKDLKYGGCSGQKMKCEKKIYSIKEPLIVIKEMNDIKISEICSEEKFLLCSMPKELPEMFDYLIRRKYEIAPNQANSLDSQDRCKLNTERDEVKQIDQAIDEMLKIQLQEEQHSKQDQQQDQLKKQIARNEAKQFSDNQKDQHSKQQQNQLKKKIARNKDKQFAENQKLFKKEEDKWNKKEESLKESQHEKSNAIQDKPTPEKKLLEFAEKASKDQYTDENFTLERQETQTELQIEDENLIQHNEKNEIDQYDTEKRKMSPKGKVQKSEKDLKVNYEIIAGKSVQTVTSNESATKRSVVLLQQNKEKRTIYSEGLLEETSQPRDDYMKLYVTQSPVAEVKLNKETTQFEEKIEGLKSAVTKNYDESKSSRLPEVDLTMKLLSPEEKQKSEKETLNKDSERQSIGSDIKNDILSDIKKPVMFEGAKTAVIKDVSTKNTRLEKFFDENRMVSREEKKPQVKKAQTVNEETMFKEKTRQVSHDVKGTAIKSKIAKIETYEGAKPVATQDFEYDKNLNLTKRVSQPSDQNKMERNKPIIFESAKSAARKNIEDNGINSKIKTPEPSEVDKSATIEDVRLGNTDVANKITAQREEMPHKILKTPNAEKGAFYKEVSSQSPKETKDYVINSRIKNLVPSEVAKLGTIKDNDSTLRLGNIYSTNKMTSQEENQHKILKTPKTEAGAFNKEISSQSSNATEETVINKIIKKTLPSEVAKPATIKDNDSTLRLGNLHLAKLMTSQQEEKQYKILITPKIDAEAFNKERFSQVSGKDEDYDINSKIKTSVPFKSAKLATTEDNNSNLRLGNIDSAKKITSQEEKQHKILKTPRDEAGAFIKEISSQSSNEAEDNFINKIIKKPLPTESTKPETIKDNDSTLRLGNLDSAKMMTSQQEENKYKILIAPKTEPEPFNKEILSRLSSEIEDYDINSKKKTSVPSEGAKPATIKDNDSSLRLGNIDSANKMTSQEEKQHKILKTPQTEEGEFNKEMTSQEEKQHKILKTPQTEEGEFNKEISSQSSNKTEDYSINNKIKKLVPSDAKRATIKDNDSNLRLRNLDLAKMMTSKEKEKQNKILVTPKTKVEAFDKEISSQLSGKIKDYDINSKIKTSVPSEVAKPATTKDNDSNQRLGNIVSAKKITSREEKQHKILKTLKTEEGAFNKKISSQSSDETKDYGINSRRKKLVAKPATSKDDDSDLRLGNTDLAKKITSQHKQKPQKILKTLTTEANAFYKQTPSQSSEEMEDDGTSSKIRKPAPSEIANPATSKGNGSNFRLEKIDLENKMTSQPEEKPNKILKRPKTEAEAFRKEISRQSSTEIKDYGINSDFKTNILSSLGKNKQAKNIQIKSKDPVEISVIHERFNKNNLSSEVILSGKVKGEGTSKKNVLLDTNIEDELLSQVRKNQRDDSKKEVGDIGLQLGTIESSMKNVLENEQIKEFDMKSVKEIREPKHDDIIFTSSKQQKLQTSRSINLSLSTEIKSKENSYIVTQSVNENPHEKDLRVKKIRGEIIFGRDRYSEKYVSLEEQLNQIDQIENNQKLLTTPAVIIVEDDQCEEFLSQSETNKDANKGVIRYALSDPTFIEKGWTILPVEKVVRKVNVYRMRPARPEFDWFERNKNKKRLVYDSGEKLAEFDDNGRGRWYYRNGRLALDYYDSEELNARQRFVIYSSGELDDRGRSHPITVLGTFDYLGNGVVFDHGGKIRLKYNQTEGVVLDRSLGPVSKWKWHSLNDPPILQQVMIDTHLKHKDPVMMKLGNEGKKRPDNDEMLAIEFDNFVKERKKKSSQKYEPFQIKMKALKINEHFSLRVLDQATVYLLFRDGSANLKLNMGMVLDHEEIVDTDTAEVGEVSTNVDRLPAATESLARIQNTVLHAQKVERAREERMRRLRLPVPAPSVDRLTAATSRPMRKPLSTHPYPNDVGSTSSRPPCYSIRKPPTAPPPTECNSTLPVVQPKK